MRIIVFQKTSQNKPCISILVCAKVSIYTAQKFNLNTYLLGATKVEDGGSTHLSLCVPSSSINIVQQRWMAFFEKDSVVDGQHRGNQL